MSLLKLACLAAVAVLALAGAGCGLVTAVASVDEPALVIFYGDTASIAAPDTVARGAPFEVRVRTFAGGCTREIARTEVRAAGDLVEIRPYNRRRRSEVCTSDLLFLEHRAHVTLEAQGPATIRALGEQRDGSTGGRDVAARLERRVVVR
jgi:hypothetical protein